MLYFLVFFQQWSIPWVSQIPLVVLFPFVLFCYRWVKGEMRLDIDFNGLILISVGFFIGFFNIVFLGQGKFSSLLYFCVLYAFVFSGLLVRDRSNLHLEMVNVGVIVGFLGIFQWFFQLVGLPYLNFETFLPDFLLLEGYNFHYPIEYGSSVEKSNGFFCLEPSFYSQFIVLAMLVEFYGRQRWYLLLFFVFAYLPSYSGSGAVVLIFAVVGAAFERYGVLRSLVFILVSAFLVYLAIDPSLDSGDDNFMGRAREFDSEGSSGYLRFVAPFIFYYDVLIYDISTNFFVGIGPGQVDSLVGTLDANFPVFVKSSIEYGFFYGVFFSLFMIFFIGNGEGWAIKFSLVAFYFVGSGAFLQPLTIYVVALFSMISRRNFNSIKSGYFF